MKLKDFRVWGLLPSHVIMLLTMVIPLGIIVLVSFAAREPYGGYIYDFTPASYVQFLFTKNWSGETILNLTYVMVIVRTVTLAALTTAISMVLSFPVAYVIARQAGRIKILLIYLVTLPFWVSMIIRVYAWLIIMGNDGWLMNALTFLGIADSGTVLLYSNGAMLTGMVYSYIPLMILPVFASIEKLDWTLLEAAHDLYGNRWKALRRVILPLTRPGLFSGGVLVFVLSVGTVLEPILLGGGKTMMIGNLINRQFSTARDWPFGAALAVILMVSVMIILLLNALKARGRGPKGAI